MKWLHICFWGTWYHLDSFIYKWELKSWNPHPKSAHFSNPPTFGVWSLLKMMTMDAVAISSTWASRLNDWLTMETEVEEDEISSNDIMAGLFKVDMLSHSATGQVASIFIRVRNLIYARPSLTDSSLSLSLSFSLSCAPRYLCLLSDSAEWELNQIQWVPSVFKPAAARKREIKWTKTKGRRTEETAATEGRGTQPGKGHNRMCLYIVLMVNHMFWFWFWFWGSQKMSHWKCSPITNVWVY